MTKLLTSSTIPRLATVIVCLLLYISASVRFDGFATIQMFINFLTDNAVLGIVAVGMTFVILSGGIDLSVGSVIALVSVSMAVLIQQKGWHPVPAGLLCLCMGVVFGTLMGVIIQFFELPPFLVTLAGMFLGRGLANVISLEAIPIQHAWYTGLSSFLIPVGSEAHTGVVPMVYIAVVIIGILTVRYTIFGRNVYAIGGSEDASRLMGIPVAGTRIGVYAVSGFCSALAGIVFTVYSSSGLADTGVALELDAIAAVVIGGTLLTGGIGGVFGTFIGVLIFGIIQAVITFEGTLNSWWTKICIAGLLLLFIVMQRVIERASSRQA